MTIGIEQLSAMMVTRAAVAQDFKAIVQGKVLSAGDAGFDQARTLWNARHTSQPLAVIQPAGAKDVAAVVNYARSNGLPLAVRGGGHGLAGRAATESGILIDFSSMKGIAVDAEARTARVEPGATWGEVDRATMAAGGLATPGGKVGSVGVAGTTLGGGIGWLVRKFGLSIDNLLSVEIVTADGQLRTASDTEHADLFWAIRGGGGNFGIVTSFTFRLHEVGTVLAGNVAYPFDQATDVLTFYRDFIETAPDELTSIAGLGHGPDGSKMVMVAVTYTGDQDEGKRVLEPLAEFGRPVMNTIGPAPYGALGAQMSERAISGVYRASKASFLNGLPDDAIATIVDRFAKATSPLSAMMIEHYGGAAARVPHDATAFVHRGQELNLVANTGWTDPAEAVSSLVWLGSTWQAVLPYTQPAVYLNFLDEDDVDRISEAYDAETYAKLAAVKAVYDPDNLFRQNYNIPPQSE